MTVHCAGYGDELILSKGTDTKGIFEQMLFNCDTSKRWLHDGTKCFSSTIGC